MKKRPELAAVPVFFRCEESKSSLDNTGGYLYYKFESLRPELYGCKTEEETTMELITSRQNPLCTHLRKLASSGS